MSQPLSFSIIVPAYNEAAYLRPTLEHLRALQYDGFVEVLIVENGSTDDTYSIAKEFESERIKVYKSGKGVSKARNAGIANASLASDWFIFLDADTYVEPTFLNELNSFLRGQDDLYTVGTTSLLPYPDSRYARAWYKLYDLGHVLTKTSMSILIVRRSLFPPLSFDETLSLAEDLKVIKEARRFGKFFFLHTTSVSTSTRRFEKMGWWYILFSWTIGAMLPRNMQRAMSYTAVR